MNNNKGDKMHIYLEQGQRKVSKETKNYYTGYSDMINNIDPRFEGDDYNLGYKEAKKDLKDQKEEEDKTKDN